MYFRLILTRFDHNLNIISGKISGIDYHKDFILAIDEFKTDLKP